MAQAIDRPALNEIEIALASVIPQKSAFAPDEDGRRTRGNVHQRVKRMCGIDHVKLPGMKKAGRNARRPHFAGAAFSKT
jgi:hypothetical protein